MVMPRILGDLLLDYAVGDEDFDPFFSPSAALSTLQTTSTTADNVTSRFNHSHSV